MTAPARRAAPLIARLPAVRGSYAAEAPLARFTWFRTGGAAEVLFRPADAADLAHFLAARPPEIAVTVIGVGSNLLVRDGGVPGVVVRLGRPFAAICMREGRIEAGAGALDITVARHAARAGVGGLEFLAGVPGTIGGALRMNAGAFGGDMAAVTVAARALDGRGVRQALSAADLGFAYRRSAVPEDWVFTAATLAGPAIETAEAVSRLAAIQRAREASQPLRTRTGGSTFKNPAPETPAWRLIEAAGCRGLRRGAAVVSAKHCNFLINQGGASAADIEALGEEVRRRVAEATGVVLEWEIRRIGRPRPELEAVIR